MSAATYKDLKTVIWWAVVSRLDDWVLKHDQPSGKPNEEMAFLDWWKYYSGKCHHESRFVLDTKGIALELVLENWHVHHFSTGMV